jgi:hypothetical protein
MRDVAMGRSNAQSSALMTLFAFFVSRPCRHREDDVREQ